MAMKIKYPNTIGILGGMGPYAALAFCRHVLDRADAQKDWEQVHMVLDNNSHIPSRTRHLLFDETSPVESMIESCQKLAAYPVSVIAVPCNSACYFLDQVQPHVTSPLLNIVDVAVASLAAKTQDISNCLVLGGYVTYTKQTYTQPLENHGIEYIHHSKEEQRKIEEIIEEIKLQNHEQERIESFIEDLIVRYDAQSIILGCTEFGCISLERFAIPVTDSSIALSEVVIEHAK